MGRALAKHFLLFEASGFGEFASGRRGVSDPFLAAWTLGTSGQALAKATLQVTTAFNGILQSAYQAFAIPMAGVASAYRISDFTIIPVLNLPVNVLLELTWTWIGAPAPLGPDIHPNNLGYAVIAGAFAKKISVP